MSTIKKPIKFHIHIDASEMSEEFYRCAKLDAGFFDQNFSERQDFGTGYRVVAPQRHMTTRFKEDENESFYHTWEVINAIAAKGGMKGYIEGEYIVFDRDFPERPFNGSNSPPFKLGLKPLRGESNEQFRQTELHLVMDENASDPRLIHNLLNTGMYPARLPKQASTDYPAHESIIFTAQGYRSDINKLAYILNSYLIKVGGIVRGSLKEERILRYSFYEMSYTQLPDIINNINVLNDY